MLRIFLFDLITKTTITPISKANAIIPAPMADRATSTPRPSRTEQVIPKQFEPLMDELEVLDIIKNPPCLEF